MQLLFVLLITGLSASAVATSKDSCSSLSYCEGYMKSGVTINTTSVDAGALQIEGLTGVNNFTFCRVSGKMPYGNNDTLNFEVWLPDQVSYNGRYLSVGNGGFAGIIDYSTMLSNLNDGFAVGGCDSGHTESENGQNTPGGYVPYLNSRAETLAWIHNSIAMFTEPAKELAAEFYQSAPKKMYYYGCSTGGAQGFALAKYYPQIFDGVFAGSAGNYYSHLILSFLWNGLHANSGAYLDQGALNFTKDAVVKSCDGLDGVLDGVLEDPTKCQFDIESLRCGASLTPMVDNTTVCLTSTQIDTVREFYAGPGNKVYPGFAKGSESEWLNQESTLYLQYGVPILQNLVFRNLSYDYETFNFGSDVDVVDEVAGPLITAISPDLSAFRDRGGKLIATQGWSDPYNSPFWPIQQHNEARTIFGQDLDDFWRLFMVPGGGHCGSASTYPQVPGTWHTLDALVSWVENGQAPSYVLATDPADGSNTTKRLCPYPEHEVYQGGDVYAYTSYACK